MAGAAIFGIISAVLRLPEIGAPIRYLSVGVKFWLEDVAGQEGWPSSRSRPPRGTGASRASSSAS